MDDDQSPEGARIGFTDGSGYERFMGAWSRLVGELFLDWLAPAPGLRWLDVGCGNGAFTQLIAGRCSPGSLAGIDPSPQQLAYARQLPSLQGATLLQGDAQALPFAADSVDIAVMPLVIFFLEDPALGVAELARVVAPGGQTAAYAWDLPGGGFPYQPVQEALEACGVAPSWPPNPQTARLDALMQLWQEAGLVQVETLVIEVSRLFLDFNDYWETLRHGPRFGSSLMTMEPATVQRLQQELRRRMPTRQDGSLLASGRAHAVRGLVPAA